MRLYIFPIVLCLASLIFTGLAKPRISKQSPNKQEVIHNKGKVVGSKPGHANKRVGIVAKKPFKLKKTVRQDYDALTEHGDTSRSNDGTGQDDALTEHGDTSRSNDGTGQDDALTEHGDTSRSNDGTGQDDELTEHGDTSRSNDGIDDTDDDDIFKKDGCWPVTDSEKLFKGLLQLEDTYMKDRKKYNEALQKADIDGQIIKDMLKTRGGARGLVVTKGLQAIPAGLNLGAHGMLKMPDSIMMFYRMKLRNDTFFTVKRFSSNMYSMAIAIKLALNDLHLIGDYDRSLTENDTSTLYYRPTFGRVELLLRDAVYMMEGRYTMVGGKLKVEHVLSNITIPDILMLFDNDTCNAQKLKQENIDDYISRMQADFDFWLKDYLTDYLAYVDLSHAVPSAKFQEFQVSKQLFVNQYVDYVITKMNNRLDQLNIAVAKIPSFRIIAIDGTEFNLTEGYVEGLDTMHRCSVATEGGDEQIRVVDADIAFSNLKVMYKYDAIVHEDIPQVPGFLILTGDQLTAHLQLGHVREPGFADIYISGLRLIKNESLIVEGAANRHISNYKHLLEHNIFSIMSNVLRHAVLSLNSLSRCFPKIKGDVDTEFGKKLMEPLNFQPYAGS